MFPGYTEGKKARGQYADNYFMKGTLPLSLIKMAANLMTYRAGFMGEHFNMSLLIVCRRAFVCNFHDENCGHRLPTHLLAVE